MNSVKFELSHGHGRENFTEMQPSTFGFSHHARKFPPCGQFAIDAVMNLLIANHLGKSAADASPDLSI